MAEIDLGASYLVSLLFFVHNRNYDFLLFSNYKMMSSEGEEEELKLLPNEEADEEEEKLFLKAARSKPLVNHHMVPSKICFFVLDGLYGILCQFLILFLTSIGLHKKEAGFISGLRFLFAAIAAPIWGYVSDKFGKQKMVFIVLCVGTVMVSFPMPWIASALKPFPSTPHNSTASAESSTEALFANDLFYAMLVLTCVCSTFLNSIHGIVDSFVMNTISSHQMTTNYGKQRWVGSVGYGLIGLLVSLAAYHVFKWTTCVYSSGICLIIMLAILVIPAGLKVASQGVWEKEELKLTKEKNMRKPILNMFLYVANFLFLVSVTVCGFSNTIVNCYLFMLMHDVIKGPKVVILLANLTARLSEVVFFLLADEITKRLSGALNIITLAVFSYFIQFALLIFVSNPWLIIPLQLLSGISYALFWYGAMEYTQSIAALDVFVTVYSIISSLYFNVGGFLATLLATYAFSNDIASLFLASCYVLGVWFLVLISYFNIRTNILICLGNKSIKILSLH